MPGSTSLEGLPYPCLGDPFQRHWIQDLAESADDMLFRMQSDIDLIDRRPRGRMRWNGVGAMVPNVYNFLAFNVTDYDIRMNADLSGTISNFRPDLPGLYYCALEFGMNADAAITKINPEVVTCDNAGSNVVTQFGRSFNVNTATLGYTMRLSGLAHIGDVSQQFRGRVRHQGGINLINQHVTFTAQYLGGCGQQLVPNPYFERNIDDWVVETAPITLTQSTTHVFRGNYSMQIAPGPAVANPVVRSIKFPATAGQTYSTVAYLYSTVFENFTWGFRWFDAASTLLGTALTGSTPAPANVWTRLARTGTAPVGTTQAEVRIRRETATTPSPTFWLDDAEAFSNC